MDCCNKEKNFQLKEIEVELDKEKEIINDNNEEKEDESSSHESIFYEESSIEKQKIQKKEKNNTTILNQILWGKKKDLSKEQKEERIKRTIDRYCKRNDRILELFEIIYNGEITNKNINEMTRLIALDLYDTKKISNKKALISQKKNDIFDRLLDLTFEEYQLFWFKLTKGKYKKGKAELINSGNMRNAKFIYDKIIDERSHNENGNKKKEKSVREIINIRNNMEIEQEKLDDVFLGYDPDISSDDEDSLDSSDEEIFSESVVNNKKSEKEKLIIKEIERQKEYEKEEREKSEKMLKLMDKEDEIDIFN